MGKCRKPTQAISFGDCLKKIEQEFTKLQKSASRFRDFSYFLCARFLNQNLKPGKIIVLAEQARNSLKSIRGAIHQLKRLLDTDRELITEITDAAQDVEEAIDALGDKIGELE